MRAEIIILLVVVCLAVGAPQQNGIAPPENCPEAYILNYIENHLEEKLQANRQEFERKLIRKLFRAGYNISDPNLIQSGTWRNDPNLSISSESNEEDIGYLIALIRQFRALQG